MGNKFTLGTQRVFGIFYEIYVFWRVKNEGAKKKFAKIIILEVMAIQSLRYYVYTLHATLLRCCAQRYT